jgi:preprotein translocase subunit SecA
MSGTLAEVAPELAATYGLGVVCIPTNRPSRRRTEREIITRDDATKWRLIAETAQRHAQAGRPVLIGTRSVAASERASARLREAGASHALLNAAQDRNEAGIVADAGAQGRITIATNMAGRGTDISLAEGVAERGGLAVILSERHDSRRIDRQLAGRGARQGEPGSFAAIISLEDSLLDSLRRSRAGRLLLKALARRPGWAGPLFSLAQSRAQRRHRAVRRELMRFDARLNATLAFAGRPD